MSSSVNLVVIVGNLGSDPETRVTSSGDDVATLSIATSEQWKDRDGNKQERTEWHRVVCWRQKADFAGRFLAKGRKVYVRGRIQTRSWEDQQTGQRRYATEIVADELVPLDSRSAGRDHSGPRDGGYGQPARPAATGGFVDDDIPFGPVEW